MDRWIEQIQGHEDNWKTLRELLIAETLPHALAFTGPSGIGKKKMAFALAQAGVCTSAEIPCGTCPSCQRVSALQSESLLIIAPTGGSLKLENAQSILQFLQLRSLSKRRFIVVDDAASMNASFANALLKILEEPPAGTYFIFVLPALSQLLPTLRSRLQVVRFFPLADAVLAKVSGADDWTVRAAQGSFTSLEEWSSEDAAALKAKAIAALADLAELRRTGFESLLPVIKDRQAAEMVTRLFQQFFRDALRMRERLEGLVHVDAKASLEAWATKSRQQILGMWQQSFQLQQDIAANLDRPLSFENFFCHGRSFVEGTHAILD